MELQAVGVLEGQRLAVAARGGATHYTDEEVSQEQYYLGGGRNMFTDPSMDWQSSGIDDNVFGPSTTMQMARGVAMDNRMLGKGGSGKRSYSN